MPPRCVAPSPRWPAALLAAAVLLGADPGRAASLPIKTFAVRIGGDDLGRAYDTAENLARFDILLCARKHHNDLGDGSTWRLLSAAHGGMKFFLYQYGDGDREGQDGGEGRVPFTAETRNSIDRWSRPNGHPSGESVYGDHYPEWFLRDSRGADIFHADVTSNRLMDVGSAAFQQYWIEATRLDVTSQPWGAADAVGVFIDHAFTDHIDAHESANFHGRGQMAIPAKYPTAADWNNKAMLPFISAIAAGLAPKPVITNSGPVDDLAGYDAWMAMDAREDRPFGMMIEDGFCAASGAGDTYFFVEPVWRLKVDLLKNVSRYSVLIESRSKLRPGALGVDNRGRPTSYHDAFWYSLASYLLGRRNQGNAYFCFLSDSDYNMRASGYWEDAYDKLDLGHALGDYRVTARSGGNVYWRPFERGCVVVNPSGTVDQGDYPLPADESWRLVTHASVGRPVASLPAVAAINLKPQRAAIVYRDGAAARSLVP